MRPTSTASMAGLLAIVLVFGACGGGGGDSSIAGTYECTLEGGGPDATVDVFEFQEDGTLTQNVESLGRTVEGTWSAEGDSVTISSELGDQTFSIEGDRLVQPTPTGDRFVCTPTS